MNVNGWNDIGYHYLITIDGVKHQGRLENITGAHTIGQNSNSIGICLVGHFDNYKPNNQQLETLYNLIQDIFNRYGKLPIYGHNKYATKTCPGKMFPMDLLLSVIYSETLKPWEKLPWLKAVNKGIEDGFGEDDIVTSKKLMVYYNKLGHLE